MEFGRVDLVCSGCWCLMAVGERWLKCCWLDCEECGSCACRRSWREERAVGIYDFFATEVVIKEQRAPKSWLPATVHSRGTRNFIFRSLIFLMKFFMARSLYFTGVYCVQNVNPFFFFLFFSFIFTPPCKM